jgi:hypothetical protein
MKSKVVNKPSAVSYDLVQCVDQRICERCLFTISGLSCEFPQISNSVPYKIFIFRLRYHKFCSRWVLKMLMAVNKTQRMTSALIFLEQYDKNWDAFLSHNVQVTGDETCVSLLKPKNSSSRDLHTFTKEAKKFKQTLSTRKLMANLF